MHPFNLKPTRKKINSFLTLLISRLNRRFADNPHSDGYEIYEEWRAKEMENIDNRYKLCQLLFQCDPDPKERAQTTLNRCIDAIRNSIAYVNEDFTFVQNNQNVWTATPTFDLDDENTILELSGVITGISVESVPRPTDNLTQGNNNSQNRWTTLPGEFNSPPPSSDRSNIKSIEDNNPFSPLASSNTNNEDSLPHESTPSSHSTNQKSTPGSLDPDLSLSSSQTNKSSSLDDNVKHGNDNMLQDNDDEDKESNLLDQPVSDDDLLAVHQAILNKEIDTIDTMLLCRWIESKAKAIDHMSEETQREREIAIATIHAHTHQVDEQSGELLRKLTKTIGTAQTKAQETKELCIRETGKAKMEIMNAQQDGIATLNRCSNMHKNILDSTISRATQLLESLQASNVVATTSSVELDRVVKTLKTAMEDAYDTYEERISETTELEKKQMTEWLNNTVSNFYSSTLYHDINHERERLKAERMLLEQEKKDFQEWFKSIKEQIPHLDSKPSPDERMLLEQERKEFQEWFTTIKAQTSEFAPNPPSDSTSQYASTQQRSNIHPSTTSRQQQTFPPYATSSSQFPTQQRDKWGELPYKYDTVVRYKNHVYDVIGYITNNDTNKPNMIASTWFYNITTVHGTDLTNCNGDHVTIFGDSTNENNPLNESSYEGEHDDNNRPNSRPSWSPSNRRLTANQFQYPIGNEPTSVNHYGLSKQGEKWNDLKIRSDDEAQHFYYILQGRLATFHVYLLEYDQITTSTGLFAINRFNCTNYEVARKEMSNALYIFLDTNKEQIFGQHEEAIHFIESYRLKCDGEGFLRNLIEDEHPVLRKNKVDDEETQPSPPQFHDFKTIYEFVNGYIRWLQKEKLRGRTSSDKEKIDHIRNSLDSRFDTAKEKIKRQLEQVYADPNNPAPFPENLKLRPELAVTITKLMPKEQRNGLTNEIIRINRLHKLMDETLNFGKATIHATSEKSQKKGYYRKKHKWADKIEWKIIKGEKCPACHGLNHNVYSTGCPEMARFCACQKFYETADKDKLEEVLKSYKKYQLERAKLQAERQSKDKAMLKILADDGYDEEDIARLKVTYFNAYKQDFDEEQYRTHNPYVEEIKTEVETQQ